MAKKQEAKFVISAKDATKTVLAGVKRGLAGVSVGAAGLALAMSKAVSAANVQEDAIKKLNTALKSTGQFTPDLTKKLQDQAAAFQKITTAGDETIIGLQSQLVAFGATEKNIKGVTEAALNLSAGMGTDLKSSALLLGKALSGEFGTLSRYGIIVDKNATDSEKMSQALAEIQKKFGGQAQSQAETFSGSIKQMSNVFGDLEEEVGFVITKNEGFKNIIVDLRKFLSGLIDKVKENREELQETATVIAGGLVAAIKTGIEAIKLIVEGVKTFIQFGEALGRGMADLSLKIEKGFQKLFDFPAKMKNLGKEMISKFQKGFFSQFDSIKEKMGNLVPDWMSKFLKQESPAELGVLDTQLWGAQAVQLYAQGMSESLPFVETSSNGLVRTIGEGMDKVKDKTSSAFGSMGKGFAEFAKKAELTGVVVTATTIRMIDNIQTGLSDSIFNFVKGIGSFKDAVKGFFTSILDSFIRLIADMIAQAALLNSIKFFKNIAFSAGGLIPPGEDGFFLGRSGEGVLTPEGVAKVGGEQGLSLLNQPGKSSFIGPPTQAQNAVNVGFDLLSGAAAGFFGNQLARGFFGGGVGTDVGSAIGGAIGFSFGPIGAGIGSFLGGSIGALFGGERLSATERAFGSIFGANQDRFADPFSALAASRLQAPGTGSDNVADALNNIVGRNLFPGTSFLRDDTGPEGVNALTVRGFQNLIASGAMTRRQIESGLIDDLVFFKGKFGKGGIVNGPGFAMVGERGPEAIIPLENGSVPVTVNNDGVMELLAAILAKMEEQAAIVLQIDGDKLAENTFRRSKAGLRTVHANGVVS